MKSAWFCFFAAAFSAVILLDLFAVSLVRVEGESMEPTIAESDFVVCLRIGYEIQRGDIVIAASSGAVVIKRVAGLPGECIRIDEDGILWIDGEEVSWMYGRGSLYREDAEYCGTEITLGEGEYFLLGDNHTVSRDSRVTGPVLKKAILGKVLYVVDL